MKETRLSATVSVLYLGALGLLPWSWFPPFPWLHEHAQWSDVLIGAAASAWVLERWRLRALPRLQPVHLAMGLYLGGAALSLLMAAPDRRLGAFKLLGMAELAVLALLTSDLAGRPRMMPAIARVIAATSLATGTAALAGVALFYAGIHTPLIGPYGALVPGAYARAQAGLYHPALLASFSIFASGVLAHDEANLPVKLRRAAQVAIGIAALLTLSRGILAFGLASAIRAGYPRGRRLAVGACAAACLMAMGLLAVLNVRFNPSQPLSVELRGGPSYRTRAIMSSFDALRAHPLWGTGPGTHSGRTRFGPVDAHLTPLNIGASLGIPALIGFLAIPVLLWRGRRHPVDVAAWSGLAGLGADALTQDIEDFRHLWVLFGLAGRQPSQAATPSGGGGRVESGQKSGAARGFRPSPAPASAGGRMSPLHPVGS